MKEDGKLVVNFTPTGMIPVKKDTPHVPITALEIIEDVLAAVESGISMVHLHIRDKDEAPDYRAEVYAEIIEKIREYAPELIICVSLSGRKHTDFYKRAEVLSLDGDLKPDMGSLTLSSLNFNHESSLNSPQMIRDILNRMNERRIKPELEVFDTGMINYAKYLIRKELLKPPYYFNLIFGNIACAQANLLHAGMMLNDLPDDSIWAMGGIGNFQLKMNALAVLSGGGVRIGLEDNIWYDDARTRLAGNLDLLRRIKRIAEVHEREIMPPGELRTLLRLQPGNGDYGTLA